MKVYARVSNAIVLPALAGFVALAWYASRGVLGQSVIDAMGIEEYFSLVGIGQLVTLAGFLVGGVAAAIATPWTPLCLGLLLTATGLATLGVVEPENATAPFLIATFGRAMSTIGVWGALAASLNGKLGSLRDAAFIATYLGTNLGAVGLTLGRDAMRDVPPDVVFVFGAVLIAFVFVGALALSGVAFVGREPAAGEEAPELPPVGPLALGLGLLAVLVALPSALGTQGAMLGYRVVEFDWLNPAVVVVVGLMMVALTAGLHFATTRVPTTLSMGPGLVLWGLGIVMILFAVPEDAVLGDPSTGNETLATIGTLVNALGEIMLIPLLYSRLSAGLPYRLGNVVLALFLILSQLPNAVANLLVHADVFTQDAIQRPFGWLGALTAILFGLIIAAAAWPTRKIFWPPDHGAVEDKPAA